MFNIYNYLSYTVTNIRLVFTLYFGGKNIYACFSYTVSLETLQFIQNKHHEKTQYH